MSRRHRPEYLAMLIASTQRGMLACLLFTTIMGAVLLTALVAIENHQIAQEQTR